jgi:uncharacterized protein YdeI (YjbR/CyaY-like superfamily)
MSAQTLELPILEFKTQEELHAWLTEQDAVSSGIFVRIYKKSSHVPTVTFAELLDEGLCFGWSESTRQSNDANSYLQKFTPRRIKGTTSARNHSRIEELIRTGRMTRAGLDALKLPER